MKFDARMPEIPVDPINGGNGRNRTYYVILLETEVVPENQNYSSTSDVELNKLKGLPVCLVRCFVLLGN